MLIGEAPSKSGDKYHMFPLSGAVAETLCKLSGIAPLIGESRYGQWTWALYENFECENLIRRWPGRQGTGSAFPTEIARSLAFVKAEKGMLDRVVVLLGARLRAVFGLTDFYAWQDHVSVTVDDGATFEFEGQTMPNLKNVYCPCQVVAIPHPSGLNRMLNDPVERDRCGLVLREAMQRARRVEFA